MSHAIILPILLPLFFGALLLVVGYFSPLPPRRAEVASEAEQP